MAHEWSYITSSVSNTNWTLCNSTHGHLYGPAWHSKVAVECSCGLQGDTCLLLYWLQKWSILKIWEEHTVCTLVFTGLHLRNQILNYTTTNDKNSARIELLIIIIIMAPSPKVVHSQNLRRIYCMHLGLHRPTPEKSNPKLHHNKW